MDRNPQWIPPPPGTAFYGKLYGWRGFVIGDDPVMDIASLHSPRARFAASTMMPYRASCLFSKHGGVPKADCGCGFYVYASLQEFLDRHRQLYPTTVPCLVSAWGKLLLCDPDWSGNAMGFRAEWMQIERVLLDAPSPLRRRLHRAGFRTNVVPDYDLQLARHTLPNLPRLFPANYSLVHDAIPLSEVPRELLPKHATEKPYRRKVTKKTAKERRRMKK